MNRRGFLGSLLGVGAIPILAKITPPLLADFIPIAEPRVLGGIGLGENITRLFAIRAYGMAEQSSIGGYRVLRGDGGILIQTALNEYGGMSHWEGRDFDQIIALPGQPFIFDVSPQIELQAFYQRAGKMYAFTQRGNVVQSDEPLCLGA